MRYVFFTDRDLGKRFPEALATAGIQVEPHHAHFAHDTPDDIWLAAVGQRGWFALTHNKRIRYTPNEIAAVRAHGVGLFILVGRATMAELAQNFIASQDVVERFISANHRPFVAKIHRGPLPSDNNQRSRPGRVTLWG